MSLFAARQASKAEAAPLHLPPALLPLLKRFSVTVRTIIIDLEVRKGSSCRASRSIIIIGYLPIEDAYVANVKLKA